MSAPLVLSLFPGIGLFDMAFEQEGFCVVRGPDLLWGGNIKNFHPPAGRFEGVIGGPPCQTFSPLANLVRANGYELSFGNLIPEYERIVEAANPEWFVMEEVSQAPVPAVPGFHVHSQLLNNRWLGEEQNRVRRISFGARDGSRLHIETVALESALWCHSVVSALEAVPVAISHGKRKPGSREVVSGALTVTRGHAIAPRLRDRQAVLAAEQPTPSHRMSAEGAYRPGTVTSSDGGASKKMWRYPLDAACRLQGLPEEWIEQYVKHAPFRADAKLKAIANGVPLPMGRAIAKAVRRAMYAQEGAA